MPNGDKTGPNGKGPKTGRGLGKAVGNEKGRGTEKATPRTGGNNKGNGAAPGRKNQGR